MNAHIFPGQGSQFSGMGADLYKNSEIAKNMFEEANDLLGFRITDIMFEGTPEQLKETKVTQPAIFLHAVVLNQIYTLEKNTPDMVAGHSLGEFSALVANATLSFEDALLLVAKRAEAMQKACELIPGTMAAVLGMADDEVEKICSEVQGIVVAANFNCPGQLVISGEVDAIHRACESLKKAGAKRALVLPVGGAFHSPLMAPARDELAKAIENTTFHEPFCPVYQNVSGKPVSQPEQIKLNLIEQLTAPVRWTQSVQNMIKDGGNCFTEIGPGNVLQGLVKKIDREVETFAASL
ncbi:MAG: ACP S-malonyltransferase [Flavobacteriaceae bacterium]|nr:ACP S-malonyltransferase [Flavobacteriaceae bacterium]